MTTKVEDHTPSARERLLAAADELFYEEGIHTVGIDRVIERAGVAKATLYTTFGNKEGLIRAYLTERKLARQERMNAGLARFHTPRTRLLGVFDVAGETFAAPTFRGCAFVNASAESLPGSAAVELSDETRAWMRELMVQLVREIGAPKPETLARQLLLVYDGMMVSARMDRNPKVAAAARATAEVLIDAALAQ
ncbi:MAG TPA: helix-turn-helix domain-containing protein [Ilumatobacteraceae bacterium]|jgi:AcrR family transcriptional regulator